MQVCHGHDRALELRVAWREGYEQVTTGVDEWRLGYRRIVGVGSHDRRIDREHVRTREVIGVVNEDSLIFRCLEGRSRRREYRMNALRLTGRRNIRRTRESMHLGLWESRRQLLKEGYIFRDLIERNVFAKLHIEFCPAGNEG